MLCISTKPLFLVTRNKNDSNHLFNVFEFCCVSERKPCTFFISKMENGETELKGSSQNLFAFFGSIFSIFFQFFSIFSIFFDFFRIFYNFFKTYSRLGLSLIWGFLVIQSVIFDAVFCRRELRRFCFRSYKNIQNSRFLICELFILKFFKQLFSVFPIR